MNRTEGLVEISKWVDTLHYNVLRNYEKSQTVPVYIGRKKKPLRAIQVAPDLWLARNKMFYRIVDNRALVVPMILVAEQYDLRKLQAAFNKAVRERRAKRKAAV